MKKLKEIDRLKALIDAGRPLSAEVVSELKRRNDAYISYSSTAIEGYGASRSETAIILESDTVIPGHKLSDAIAVRGIKTALTSLRILRLVAAN